jgi:hypothetical protein
MLRENFIFVDSVRDKSSTLQKYVSQKPNPRFLNLPFALYFHNLGNLNSPKTASEWGKKNPRSYNFVKSVFSEKQSIAYANSSIGLNNWFLKSDGPVIVNPQKVKNTSDNLLAYYKTQGYFKSSVDTIINRYDDKKATVEYYVTKGKPTTLDSILIKIESPVLDSIYKASNYITLLKKGDQYNDQTFRNEAKNTLKLFKNNGIYHFKEAALGFYVDSTRTDYKTNVDFLMSGNRLVEKDGRYLEKPFKIQTIKEVNIITDYSFTRKTQKYLDSISFKGINFFCS